MSRDEQSLINGAKILETLSELMPDIDPGVAIAAVEEFDVIVNAAKNLRELGVIRFFGLGAVLENGQQFEATIEVG